MMAVSYLSGDATTPTVYIAGQVEYGLGKSQICTWRYNANGTLATGWPQLWPSIPEGKGAFAVAAVAPTNGGEMYVVGAYYKDGEGQNIVLLKYLENGTMAPNFPTVFNDPVQNGDDYPVDMVMDPAGNVWVLGVTTGLGTGADYLVIGFNAVTAQWIATATYNNSSANKSDIPVAIKAFPVGIVQPPGCAGASSIGLIVTGTSFDNTTQNDIVTIGYVLDTISCQLGMTFFHRYTRGGGATSEVATGMATSPGTSSGVQNIFVCGSTNADSATQDALVIGYLNAAGSPEPNWNSAFGSATGDDSAVRVVAEVDQFDERHVYVASTLWNAGASTYDGDVRALFESDGTARWLSPQGFILAGDDRVADMVAVTEGDVYVLRRWFNGTNYDYVTSKILGTGTLEWTRPPLYNPVYDAPFGGTESPASIKALRLDPAGARYPNVFVSGRSQGIFDAHAKYATVRYSQCAYPCSP